MRAGRINVVLGLHRYNRPHYWPRYYLLLIGAALWAGLIYLALQL